MIYVHTVSLACYKQKALCKGVPPLKFQLDRAPVGFYMSVVLLCSTTPNFSIMAHWWSTRKCTVCDITNTPHCNTFSLSTLGSSFVTTYPCTCIIIIILFQPYEICMCTECKVKSNHCNFWLFPGIGAWSELVAKSVVKPFKSVQVSIYIAYLLIVFVRYYSKEWYSGTSPLEKKSCLMWWIICFDVWHGTALWFQI